MTQSDPLYHDQTIEDQVMEIVYEFVQKDKPIDFYHLYNICVKEIDAQSTQILSAIENLAKEKRITFGRKIIRDFVLANPTRKQIYNFIKNHPGINYSGIYKALGIHNESLVWNLKVLARFDCLVVLKVGNRKIYAVRNTPKRELLLSFLVRNKKIKEILKILDNTTYEVSDISKKTEFSYQTTAYHVKSLVEQDILKPEIDFGKKVYAISEEYKPFWRRVVTAE